MKKLVLILSFLMCTTVLFSTSTIDYPTLFSDDYKFANKLLANHADLIKKKAAYYHHSVKFSTAIVFPELLRYSIFSDFFETKTLELLYIQSGSSKVDYSIGYFQMKPSFVEQLEQDISTNKRLKQCYSKLLINKKLPIAKQRKIRLQRLKTIDWQLTYLHAFIAICNVKFSKINFKNTTEKLNFFATAYNCGYRKKIAEIIQKSTQSHFPYGMKYKGTQYSYCAISNYYLTQN